MHRTNSNKKNFISKTKGNTGLGYSMKLRNLLDAYYKCCVYLACACLVAICTFVSIQVFFNAVNKIWGALSGVSIGLMLPSYNDFTGFFLVGATFLAAAHTLHAGKHIRVMLILSKISHKGVIKFIELFACGLSAIFMVTLSFYNGVITYESFIFNDTSAGMIPIPIWIPQTIMTFGCFTLFVALVDRFSQLISEKSDPVL
jgi:TRAP-type C4-dicarboxylate transport system permease small subunit